MKITTAARPRFLSTDSAAIAAPLAAHNREMAILACTAGIYIAGSVAATLALGGSVSLPQLTLGYLLLILPFPAFLLIAAALRIARTNRENQSRELVAAWNRWRVESGMSSAARIALLPLFMAGFTSFKFLIPAAQPFALWDERLAGWDRQLHGIDPWMLLQPIYDIPFATFFLNALYYPVWFCVSLGSWVFVATRNHPYRQQFLLTFLMLWIVLGTLAGASMSSAGPILYDRATGDHDRFSGLLHELQAVDESSPLIALVARDRLWQAYESGIVEIGTGISAMPSLHVAIATLCALFAWRCGPRAGTAMSIYALIIFLASIHLGWHYALDGYVSLVSTVLLWGAVGWALRRAGLAPR